MNREEEKMNDPRHDITSFQLMSFTISAQIGIGSLFLPSMIVQQVGRDGWISTMLSGFISTIFAAIIMLLLKRYRNKSIFEINCLLYGKIGYFLNIIYIGYLIFITGTIIRAFEETINIVILKATPPIVITFFIMLPSIYATAKGLKVICRFSILASLIYFVIILTCFLNFSNIRYTYLMPIGEAGLLPILKGMLINVYSYLGFELAALIYPNISNKEKGLKYMVTAMLFTTVFYTLLVVFLIMLFGEIKLSMLVFPMYSMEQIISLPVIERMDTIFILLWIPTMGSTLRAYLFSAYYSTSILFKIKRSKLLLAVVILITVIISRIPPNFESLNRYSFYAAIYGVVVIALIIVNFFVSLFRGKGVRLN